MTTEGTPSVSRCFKDIGLCRKTTSHLRALTITLFCFLFTFQIYAQVGDPIFNRLNEEFPEIDDVIGSIERDSRGYVWFGGFYRLQRYDGISVKEYDIKHYQGGHTKGGLSIIFEDSMDNLWVFCNGFILLYDPSYDDFHYLKIELPDLRLPGSNDPKPKIPEFKTVTEDKEQRLWIGFAGEQEFLVIRVPIQTLVSTIKKSNPSQVPFITLDQYDQFHIDISTDNYQAGYVFDIVKILADANGDIWINREGWIERYTEDPITKKGIFVKYLETINDNGQIVGVHGRYSRIDNEIEGVNTRIFLDKNERIWATTANMLYQFLDKNPEQDIPKDSVINFPLFSQSLYTDFKNGRNIPSQNKYINCYNLGDNLNYSGELNFYKKNLIWLIRRNGKVIDAYALTEADDDLVEFEKFNQYDRDLTNPSSWRLSIPYVHHFDQEGIFWAADRTIFDMNSEGVVSLNTRDMFMFSRISRKSDDPKSIPNIFFRIHKDYKGNVWLTGVNLYYSHSDLSVFEEVITNAYTDLEAVEDHFNNLWFGSKGGIQLVDLKAFYSGKDSSDFFYEVGSDHFDIQLQKEYGDNWIVHDMILDKSQTIWVYVRYANNTNEVFNRPFGTLLFCDLGQIGSLGFNNYNEVEFKKFEFYSKDSIYFRMGKTDDFWGFEPSLIPGNEKIYLLTATALIRIDPETRDYEIFETGNKDPSKPFTRMVGGRNRLIDESIPDSIKIYGVEWLDGFIMKDNYLKVITFTDQPGNRKLESITNYDDNRFPGFPSKPLMDDSKNLWFKSDRGGLFYYNPIEDRILEFNNEYIYKGMLGPIVYRDHEGFMYFVTLASIQMFHPDSINQNPYVPAINISDIKVHGRSIVSDKDTARIEGIRNEGALTLPYSMNNVSLSFNATSLINAKLNLYKYKLEGWDDKWIEANAFNRTATYSKLSPGRYTFKILGSNNDGIWNEKETTLGIIILPPWWATWWAYTIYVVSAGAIIFGIFRFFFVRKYLKKVVSLEKMQVEKMKNLDTMKSRFFANVSHEFRTPLTLILGPLKQLLEEEKEVEKKSRLSMIARSSRKLLFLVNQLLDFAKLKTGRISLKAEKVDIVSFTQRRFASFESLATSRGINFQFESDTDKLMVYLDKEKLEKVIVNLLSNAFKFTADGDVMVKIRKNASNQEVDASMGVAEIMVKDGGIGMDSRELKNIFERYYQISNSTSGKGGSGLGLTLVKELVELHHGEVKVKSKRGKGSTFKIHLPLGKDHLEESELILKDDPIPELIYDETYSRPVIDESLKEELFEVDSKAHLLVVDDNTDMRNYLKEILQDDFIIEEAINGLEGITRAIEHDPDLIISDIMMPEMDGTELCQKLKSDERISHIPVVLLTARAGKSDRLKGFEIGADEYITKPFNPTELRIRVQNLIEQRKILRERFRKDITLQPRDIAITSTDERFLEKVMKILEKFSSNDEFGTDQFSKEIGLSRSQLYRKLKALTDQSTSEFIRSYRLNHARQLLEANFGNVADVSYEAGFSSPSYFTECFKTQFGVLPSDYTNHDVKDSNE